MRVLVNRYHGSGAAETILKGMSEENIQQILSQEVYADDPLPALIQPQEVIKKIHYSWLRPVIEQLPGELQTLMVQSLPSFQASGLQKMMDLTEGKPTISMPIKAFLLNLLSNKLSLHKHLPVEFLPQSQLTKLAEMTKSQLVRLIDFLGVQDLAEAVRFIVDKKKLNNIYNWLAPLKQKYLKICLHQKDKLPIPKLELDHWDGNFDKLEMVLHRRGMIRLGKALSGQHPDLFWHIIHILDIGRGTVLNKYYTQESIPGVTPALTQQLTGLVNFFETQRAET